MEVLCVLGGGVIVTLVVVMSYGVGWLLRGPEEASCERKRPSTP